MTDFEQRYVAARKAVIARDLARLNPMQRQGAMTTEGPLLLLAGAGSGKTTVLIQRVYNLLTYGRGSDSDEVPDWATEEDLDVFGAVPGAAGPGAGGRRVHRLCAVDAAPPMGDHRHHLHQQGGGRAEGAAGGPCWGRRPTMCGPPPSTPPASASCGGTLTASALTRTSPSTIPTTPSGSSRTF